MSKPINKIHNVETGEVIEVEMTDEEYAVYLQQKNERAAIDAAIANKKAEIEAKLAALGLTPADLKIL